MAEKRKNKVDWAEWKKVPVDENLRETVPPILIVAIPANNQFNFDEKSGGEYSKSSNRGEDNELELELGHEAP
jgi:hypothetical protein